MEGQSTEEEGRERKQGDRGSGATEEAGITVYLVVVTFKNNP